MSAASSESTSNAFRGRSSSTSASPGFDVPVYQGRRSWGSGAKAKPLSASFSFIFCARDEADANAEDDTEVSEDSMAEKKLICPLGVVMVSNVDGGGSGPMEGSGEGEPRRFLWCLAVLCRRLCILASESYSIGSIPVSRIPGSHATHCQCHPTLLLELL